MTKGIYFLDKNVNLLSDIESFFVVNDTVCFRGGCGLLQQAKQEIENRSDIDIIVISDNLIDATCVEALKTFIGHPARKIAALRSRDDVTREQLSKHAVVIAYPYSCNIIEETIKRMGDARTYSEDDLERIAESRVQMDNPFSRETMEMPERMPQISEKKMSFQERLKSAQLNRYQQADSRIIPQKVVAIHSQKGGVGKSTISRELAISTSCIQIKNDAMIYTPKVCLCDFDFEAADISAIMNLNGSEGIMTWCEDIEYEVRRSGDRIEDIRFTENIIKERYLQKHESGVYVLCAPERKTDCFKIECSHIQAIIENLRLCDFDVIVMDTGPNILDYTLTALSCADEVFAVCNCDMLSARRIDGMISDIYGKIAGFDMGKLRLLINRMREKSTVTPFEISKTLNIPLVGELPYYPEIVDINNEGVSVFLRRRKASGRASEYAAAFKALARNMIKTENLRCDNRGHQHVVDGLEIAGPGQRANLGIFRK